MIALALVIGWTATVAVFLAYLNQRERSHDAERAKLLLYIKAPAKAVLQDLTKDKEVIPARTVPIEDDDALFELWREREGAEVEA